MTLERGMDKEDVIHAHSHKNEWNNAICRYMDAPRDDHTKWSKSDRERQISWYHSYMQSDYFVKLQMNLLTKKQTWGYWKETYGYQRGKVGEGINQKFVMNTYILLYIRQIINQELLYSTENSTQFSVVTYMRKEFKKEGIYVTESLCCTPETNTL